MRSIRIMVSGQAIYVEAEYDLRLLCKTVSPYAWLKDRHVWQYPATPSIAGALAVAFRQAGKIEGDDAYLALLGQYHRALEDSQRARDGAPETVPEIPITSPDAPPWLHQRRAFAFCKPLAGAMLAMAMGVGKSRVAIDLMQNRGHRRVLVLCPRAVVSVWQEQVRLYAVKPVRAVYLDGGDVKQKLQRMQWHCEAFDRQSNPEEMCLVVVNYESARTTAMAAWLLGQSWDLVVLDESHRLKAPSGITSRFVARLCAQAPYRLGLTGTPMPHSLLDVFAQYRAIDRNIFGVAYTPFRARYGVFGGYGNHELVSYQHEEELREKFYSIAFRVTAEEVLELPEQQHVYRTFALTGEGARVYREMERDMIAQVQSGEIVASNALVRLLRLQQVTSGFLPTGDGQRIERVDRGKEGLLDDILNDVAPHEPLVVFARFRHDLSVIRAVCQASGRTVSELSGSAHELEAWHMGKTDVLVAQIQSGSVGIDLTRAHYCFLYSLGYNLAEYEQALKRLHRAGQRQSVTYVHLLARGTVDEQVYRALRERKDVIDRVLEEFKHAEISS